jgi:hypothetical protein
MLDTFTCSVCQELQLHKLGMRHSHRVVATAPLPPMPCRSTPPAHCRTRRHHHRLCRRRRCSLRNRRRLRHRQPAATVAPPPPHACRRRRRRPISSAASAMMERRGRERCLSRQQQLHARPAASACAAIAHRTCAADTHALTPDAWRSGPAQRMWASAARLCVAGPPSPPAPQLTALSSAVRHLEWKGAAAGCVASGGRRRRDVRFGQCEGMCADHCADQCPNICKILLLAARVEHNFSDE